MTHWKKALGSATLMALAWAAAWASIAILVGWIVDPHDAMDEMWVAIGAYPGFLCGALTRFLLGRANGHHALAQTPMSGAWGWGAASGILVGALPSALLVLEGTPGQRGWLPGALTVTVLALASAGSGACSLVLARRWVRRKPSLPGDA